MIQPRFAVLLCIAFLIALVSLAKADVVINVDIPTQRMHVTVDGVPTYTWPVATARRGMRTPTGTFHPQWLDRDHRSHAYHNAPMPHSIFFKGGYAIHGSYDTVGRPASHGCVRLYPKDAAVLFALVQEHGASHTTIIISK